MSVLVTIALWIACYFLANLLDSVRDESFKSLASVLKMLLEAVGILCIVLIGTALERRHDHDETAKRVADLIRQERIRDYAELRNQIIPASHDFGLAAVEEKFDFYNLFESLEQSDQVDIFFTYHSNLENALERFEWDLSRKGVSIRLLLSYDRSSQTVRRFREINVVENDPNWSGESVDESSAIARLTNFLRIKLPFFEKSASSLKIDWRVYDNLPDHPIIVVRNATSGNAYLVKYVWIGLYLKQAAIRMPAVKWVPVSDESETRASVALESELYFEMRWRAARSLEEMDQFYGSGEVWRDAIGKAGVNPEKMKEWSEKWVGTGP